MESNIQQVLTQFFCDQFNVEPPSTSTDLIEAGILDSLMLIEVVMFRETEVSLPAELDDLEIENFLSIDTMTRFVATRQPTAARPDEQRSLSIDERGT